jgi:hypothetical protein
MPCPLLSLTGDRRYVARRLKKTSNEQSESSPGVFSTHRIFAGSPGARDIEVRAGCASSMKQLSPAKYKFNPSATY